MFATEKGGFKKIEVQDMNGKVLCVAHDAVIDNGRMILKGYNLGIVQHQRKVNCIAYMEDGIVPFDAVVTMSMDRQMNLEVLGAGLKEDRRDSLKVRTSVEETIMQVKSTGNASRYVMMIQDVIKLRDISMGGIGFMSNRPYFKHQKLMINLSNVRPDLVVEALVLRKKRLGDMDEYKYAYGCKFIGVTDSVSRVICEHVFKIQVEENEREKERKELIG